MTKINIPNIPQVSAEPPFIPDDLIERQVLEAMADTDTPAPREGILVDGKVHRYEIPGGKRGNRDGAYRISPMGYGDTAPGGWFQNWRTGETVPWVFYFKKLAGGQHESIYHQWVEWQKSEKVTPAPTSDPRAAYKRAREERQKKWEMRLADGGKASQAAREAYQTYGAVSGHPYLERKGITPLDGDKVRVSGDKLVVPVYSIAERPQIQTLQFINPKGEKRFWPGAPVAGGAFILEHNLTSIETNEDDGVEYVERRSPGWYFLCEGYATGAAVRTLLEHCDIIGEAPALILCAMAASNLRPVAEALHGIAPEKPIIIAADDDMSMQERTGHNPGLDKALAIKAAGLAQTVAVPPFRSFPEGSPMRDGTDWNDFLNNGREEHKETPWETISWERAAAEAFEMEVLGRGCTR